MHLQDVNGCRSTTGQSHLVSEVVREFAVWYCTRNKKCLGRLSIDAVAQRLISSVLSATDDLAMRQLFTAKIRTKVSSRSRVAEVKPMLALGKQRAKPSHESQSARRFSSTREIKSGDHAWKGKAGKVVMHINCHLAALRPPFRCWARSCADRYRLSLFSYKISA